MVNIMDIFNLTFHLIEFAGCQIKLKFPEPALNKRTLQPALNNRAPAPALIILFQFQLPT